MPINVYNYKQYPYNLYTINVSNIFIMFPKMHQQETNQFITEPNDLDLI